MADINWSDLSAISQISKVFLDMCFQIGATQCVDFPTRNNNILDLILSSDQNMIQEIQCAEPFSLSDHCCISCKIQPLKKSFKNRFIKPCFKRADYELINSFLATVDWNDIYSKCEKPEDYFCAFKEVLDYVISNFVPFTCEKPKMQAPWYNARLKSLKRIKQRHWQQYRKIQKYCEICKI